jgi:hypothetical protein
MIYLIIIGLIIVIAVIVQLYLIRFFIHTRKTDGELIVVVNDNGKKLFSLELDTPPEEILKMKTITFKVINENEEILSQYKQ